MAVNSSLIARTGNVFRMKGVHFLNSFSKKLRFEEIDFSQYDTARFSMAVAYGWAVDGFPEDTSPYEIVPRWDHPWKTYKHSFNIASKYNDGAKYLYVLGDCLEQRSSGKIAYQSHTPFVLLNSSGYPNQGGEAQLNTFKVINVVARDEQTVVGGIFDTLLAECVYDLSTIVNDTTFTQGVFNYVAYPEANDEGNGYSSVHPNTAIDKLIAYWVYEE